MTEHAGAEQSEERLRRSEAELTDFVENGTIGLHRVGPDGRILWANRAELALLGYTAAEYIGRSIADFHVDQDVIAEILASLLRGEAIDEREARLRAKDGSIKTVLIDSSGYFRDGTFVHSRCFTRDITARRAAEQAVREREMQLQRLLKVTAALADAVTTREVLAGVVDNVAAAAGAASVALWLIDDDARTLSLARSIGFDKATRTRFDRIPLDANPSMPMLDALRRREPLWMSSQGELTRAYPHLRDAILSPRAYRLACLPIASQEHVAGVLVVTAEVEGETSEDERNFLMLVARYAGQAIERLRLLDAERKSRADAVTAADRLNLLHHVSRAFTDAGLDLGARLRDVARELSRSLDSSIHVALSDSIGLLHLTAVHHPIPEAHERLSTLAPRVPLRVGKGMTGTIAEVGQSVLEATVDPEEVAARASGPYAAFLKRYPVYAMMGVPLRVHGRIIGTVTAARCRPGESFTAEDLKLLDELGERAALAIENARLHGEMVNGRARAEQLYHFAQAIVAADKVDVVFEAALDAIQATLGASRAAILTFDSDGVMRFKAWRKLSETYRRAVEGHSPWARDAVAPQAVLIADVATDPVMVSFRPLFHEERIGSLAFIPLVTRGQLIGKLMVYYERPHRYSQQELALASSIAHHVASVTARFAAITRLEDTIRYNHLVAGILAHDLRNPLGAMMTAAQVLLQRREGESDGQSHPIKRIVSSGQRMMRMIDELLDLTRTKAGGGIQLEPRDTNLGDLCNQAVVELESAFPQWTIRRESAGELHGRWDPDRLLQIISNLVSNAGQHGRPEGIVEIKLDGRRPDTVTLAVHNGGAIPATLLPSLFDPFRGTRRRRDASRGLGLGLYIAKEIAVAHGGTVDVTSTPETGTSFVLLLPRPPRTRDA